MIFSTKVMITYSLFKSKQSDELCINQLPDAADKNKTCLQTGRMDWC